MKFRQPKLEQYANARYKTGYLPADIHNSNGRIWVSKRDLARTVFNNQLKKANKKGI